MPSRVPQSGEVWTLLQNPCCLGVSKMGRYECGCIARAISRSTVEIRLCRIALALWDPLNVEV